MRKSLRELKDLSLLDGLEIHTVIGLAATWLFGLIGLGAWLTGMLIGRFFKK